MTAPIANRILGRLLNYSLIPAALLAVAASFRFLELDLTILFSRDGFDQMGSYVRGFLRPDFSPAQLSAVCSAAIVTLAMSAVGTLLAALVALWLALPASGRLGQPALAVSRFFLNILRAIPELVWAALMVLAAGLGPNAGTLALAVHTAGVLGRLFAEALENAPVEPAAAIRMAGGGRVAAFCYGTLPDVWPQMMAYALYRWENNIRMASVLGFVGAGGLGQMLYVDLSLFHEAQAATVILAMLILVLGVDALSSWMRMRWVRA